MAKRKRKKLSRKSRRNFLRVLAGGGVAAVALRAGQEWRQKRRARASGQKIEITPTCIGCTGCAAVCPTAAIAVVPGGIEVIDELCVSCGYCQAGCPVDGIRVLRGRDHA